MLSAGGGAALAQATEYTFEQWIEVFRPRALAKGIAPAVYDGVMHSLTPNTKVFDFDKSQPEVVQPIWRYLNQRITEWKINTGRERVKQYADVFGSIERVYGVDRYHLCALWGMESAYGGVMEKQHVVDSLATLAWGDARRRTYWEQELTNSLVIIGRGWSTPAEMIGSWAGAMGHTQWMPEVWLNMGVDFDGDGRISPFGRPDDSLAGTARYLVERGKYRRGETWGYEVRLKDGFNVSLADGRSVRSIARWKALGVSRVTGEAFPRPADSARLSIPAGIRGPAFLFLHNLTAIRSYNPSTKYALSIGHLADRIRGGGDFLQPWPTDERQLNLSEAQELQARLTQLGFDTGGTDGRIGDKTQAALQAWQTATGMQPADGFPTDKVLARLRGG
ncbi:MAG: lytic murein transglycosylase [Ancalomicrobiaceae bacterium]|nr:lytic murein transglycosylase [Ancalomicrobiaceae bacterium]